MDNNFLAPLVRPLGGVWGGKAVALRSQNVAMWCGQKGRGVGREFLPALACLPLARLSPLLFSPPKFFVPVKLARRLIPYLNSKFNRYYCFCISYVEVHNILDFSAA